jgi:hypothetical protein
MIEKNLADPDFFTLPLPEWAIYVSTHGADTAEGCISPKNLKKDVDVFDRVC